MADKKIDLSGFDETVKNYDLSGFEQKPEEYGMLGAAGLGAAKGLSLGFDDEIAGMATAITKKIGGSDQDFWDIYRNIRDSVRKEHETAEAQQPVASFIGELGGGLVLPGGIVGKGATKGASFLQKMSSMAKSGAKVGAIGGAGLSKADLTSGEGKDYAKAIEDVAGGAVLGAGVGAGMQALGTGISKVGKEAAGVAKQFPFASDVIEVFKRTKGGEELLGKVDEFSQANRDLARGIIQDLEDLRKFSGGIKGESLKKIDDSGLKVKIDDIVDSMNVKLESMGSAHPAEQADIDTFRQVLGNLVKDETKRTVKYIPKATNPKLSLTAEEKAAGKVAKKTAEAEARDAIKVAELEEAIAARVAEGAEAEDIAPLVARLRRLQGETQFPPSLEVEPLTGLPVQGVARGVNKSPIVEAIPPMPEVLPKVGEKGPFTPIQKLITETVERGRTEATPTEIEKLVKSLGTAYEKSETHVGRGLASDAKMALRERLDQAISQSTDPKVIEALEGLKRSIDQVKNVATAQERLSLPGYMGQMQNPERARTEAIDRLQRLIQETQKPGSQGKQKIGEAVSRLEEVMPGMGKTIEKDVMEGSRKEYLAREIAKESALSKDPTTLYASGKSLALLGARKAGQAAQKLEQAVAGPKAAGQKIADMGKSLYNSSPQQLQDLASAVATKSKTMSDTLMKIAGHEDQVKRRAMLFALMQQPAFREVAEGFFSEGEQ